MNKLIAYEQFLPDDAMNFFRSHWEIPLIAVTSYASMIYFGPKIMSARKPFGLEKELALWNLFLAVFSTIGAFVTVPDLLHRIKNDSFMDTVCANGTRSWGAKQVGVWVMLFCASKIPELIDTVFIVLRKKPLIFLHWYHHVTVLLFCWDAYSNLASSGLYFVAMNFTVHAIMYSYYYLKAAKICPRWFPAYLITILQIAQMVVGTFVCVSNWFFYLKDQECHINFSSMVAGALMYASYLGLFVHFALGRFVYRKVKKDQ